MKKYIILFLFLSVFLYGQMPAPAPLPSNTKDLKQPEISLKTVTVEGLSFGVPSTWTKLDKQNLWKDDTGNSVNVIVEVSNLDKKTYFDLSLKNLNKMIKTYKYIDKGTGKAKNVGYDWLLGSYDLKEFGGNGLFKTYSIFVDAGNLKYVVTLGGRAENFEKSQPIFKAVMNSISLNRAYKREIDDKGGIKTIEGKLSLEVPKGWIKSNDKDMWVDPKTRSSVNVTKENAVNMDLNKYLDLSLENLQKSIPSYKLEEKKIVKINGTDLGILYGEFNMYNIDLKLYSIVMDINGVKYVISLGGPKVSFTEMKPVFDKILNSIKKL